AIWDLRGRIVALPLGFIAGFGGLMILTASYQLSHWELVGLRQVYDFALRRPSHEVPFQTPGLYQVVRHPLMLGFLIFIWATPYLTVSRLLFNVGMTAYILL